jgi:hypothetical protein
MVVCVGGTIHGFVGFAKSIDAGARALDLICDQINRAAWQ